VQVGAGKGGNEEVVGRRGNNDMKKVEGRATSISKLATWE
jgi:hypothetical protein